MRRLSFAMKTFLLASLLVMAARRESAGVDRPHAGVLQRFDHDMHVSKVFQARKISCSHCHTGDFSSNAAKPLEGGVPLSSKSIFTRSPMQICHECHRSAETVNHRAPQACYSCHVGNEELLSIKPLNHSGVTWRTAHSLEAKTDAGSCNNCHTTGQCTQCHLQRNNVELSNHSRNFKFFHSVQARARPQSCDSCHTKGFCTDCHSGVKR